MKTILINLKNKVDRFCLSLVRPKFSAEVKALLLRGGNTFIFDFDSFLWEESLDAMLYCSIKNLLDREERKQQISDIMDAGMENRITLQESLQQRFEVASLTPQVLEEYLADSRKKMDVKMAAFIQFLQAKNQKIFVFSGGFKDFIVPFMADYGVPSANIYANELVLQGDGTYSFDTQNLMAASDGKTRLFAQLKARGDFVGTTFSFGDSSRDVQMGADYGFGYGGIKRRENVEKNSANYFYTPNHILRLFQTILV